MKKIMALLVVLTLCLCGCGSSGKQDESCAAASTGSVETDPTGETCLEEHGENVNEYYENSNPRKEFTENPATGEYSIFEYYENGNISKSSFNDPATGKYAEWEYYEDGTQKVGSYGNHNTGEHHKEEFYENGQMKHERQEYPSQIFEGKYDEEGYCTYMYSKMPMPGAKKGLYRTEECFSDENGKLIKIILNGEVKDDPVILAEQARLNNFRE